MKPWNASYSSVVVGRPRPLGHLTNFFLISENSLKFANFFCWGNEFSIYGQKYIRCWDTSRTQGIDSNFSHPSPKCSLSNGWKSATFVPSFQPQSALSCLAFKTYLNSISEIWNNRNVSNDDWPLSFPDLVVWATQLLMRVFGAPENWLWRCVNHQQLGHTLLVCAKCGALWASKNEWWNKRPQVTVQH